MNRSTLRQLRKVARNLRLPVMVPPDAIARTYNAKLARLLDQMMEIVRRVLVPRLEGLSAEMQLDAMFEDIAQIFGLTEDEFKKLFGLYVLSQIARETANQLSRFQAHQLERHLRPLFNQDALRPNLFGGEAWLEREIALFVANNVSLIRSLPKQFLTELEPLVTKHFSEGGSFEELAQLIEDRFQITVGKARVIAADQANKFTQALNQRRQEALGIDKFVWVTQRDERVRDTHAARDGKVLSWAKPAGGILPGEEVNCRCQAVPYLDDL